jgi:hypothetical protein
MDLSPRGTIPSTLRVVEDTPSRFVLELDKNAETDPSWFFPLIGLPALAWIPIAWARDGIWAALLPLPFALACLLFGTALFVHRKSHRTTLVLGDGRLTATSLGIFTRTASVALSEIRDLVSAWYVVTKAGKGGQLAVRKESGWPVVLWFNVKDPVAVVCAERLLRERLGPTFVAKA